jgi:hypothetical protein
MSTPQKIISVEHVQAAVDAVLGIDPSQAPTDPSELNERLSLPQPGLTEAVSFLFSQQNSKHLTRAVPLMYVLLESANRAFPEEMKEEIKSKAFVTSIAALAVDAKASASDASAPFGGALRERQPELIGFLESRLRGENSIAAKLSLDDRTGMYALCLGTIRVIERQLAGAEKPAQAAKVPGRNEVCFCGSGKKYKKCHGGPNAATA